MDIQAVIKSKQHEQRELRRRYAHAAERKHEVRTRGVAPDKEAMRRKILKRYELECKSLVDQINDLGEEIFKLQRNGVESE